MKKVKIKKINKQEINLYIIFGVMTTILNIVAYGIFRYFNLEYKFANTLAFIVALLFAYMTNKIIVFKSICKDFKALILEFSMFFLGRIVTYFFELLILMLLIDIIKIKEMFSKLVATFIVVILNYILSKKAIFTKGKGSSNEKYK